MAKGPLATTAPPWLLALPLRCVWRGLGLGGMGTAGSASLVGGLLLSRARHPLQRHPSLGTPALLLGPLPQGALRAPLMLSHSPLCWARLDAWAYLWRLLGPGPGSAACLFSGAAAQELLAGGVWGSASLVLELRDCLVGLEAEGHAWLAPDPASMAYDAAACPLFPGCCAVAEPQARPGWPVVPMPARSHP